MEHVLKDLLNDLNHEGEVFMVDIGRVHPDPRQPRKVFDEESLNQLAQSIQTHGLLQPLLVYPEGDDYYIIAGERRFRACQRSGVRNLPIKVVPHPSLSNRMELSLVENIQRENLNPMDISEAFQFLIQQHNMTQEEVAQKVAKSRSYVANMMRLSTLPEKIQDSIRSGAISFGHAKALLSSDDPEQMLEEILRHQYSVREVEKRVRKVKDTEVNDDLEYIRLAIQERIQFPTKIEMKESGKGRIILEFDSPNALDAMLQKLK